MIYAIRNFWTKYFYVRCAYLVLTLFVISKMTTLGDTSRYLSGEGSTDKGWFADRTAFVDHLGTILGSMGGGLLSNIPAMLLSFGAIRWTIDQLKLREKVDNYLLFILLCLPSFCIWTSAFGKEIFGLCFSAFLGVQLIRFLQNDFTFKWQDCLGLLLCLFFKPQYAPFIVLGLFYVYVSKKLKLYPKSQVWLALLCLFCIGISMYAMLDYIDNMSFQMYAHFDVDGTSTRPDIFQHSGDFFRHALCGMFIAFWGPTISEMTHSPLQLLTGLESLFILFLFGRLCLPAFVLFWKYKRFYPLYFFCCLFVIGGILLMHYPFGVFNPGSAIRYRTNFFFLFEIFFLGTYVHFRTILKSYQRLFR